MGTRHMPGPGRSTGEAPSRGSSSCPWRSWSHPPSPSAFRRSPRGWRSSEERSLKRSSWDDSRSARPCCGARWPCSGYRFGHSASARCSYSHSASFPRRRSSCSTIRSPTSQVTVGTLLLYTYPALVTLAVLTLRRERERRNVVALGLSGVRSRLGAGSPQRASRPGGRRVRSARGSDPRRMAHDRGCCDERGTAAPGPPRSY